MAIRGVLRVGEVAIRVLDLAAARRHYGEYIGLHQTLDDGRGICTPGWFRTASRGLPALIPAR